MVTQQSIKKQHYYNSNKLKTKCEHSKTNLLVIRANKGGSKSYSKRTHGAKGFFAISLYLYS